MNLLSRAELLELKRLLIKWGESPQSEQWSPTFPSTKTDFMLLLGAIDLQVQATSNAKSRKQ